MSYKSKVYSESLKIDALVIDNDFGDYQNTIEVEAPDGYKWIDGDCQILCGHWFKGEKGSKPNAWKDLLSRIIFGIEPLNKEER